MKTGILLINLGTPDSPKVKDVRKYLTEFLNDPRVIDIPALARFLLVNAIIVPFRSSKSAKLYNQIWSDQGSPLLQHSNNLKNKLQEALGASYVVALGMRYQRPDLNAALNLLKESKVDRIILVPLYPHYASSSTGSSVQKALELISKWEVIPSITTINKFYDYPGYISAIETVARKYNFNEYDFFLFSYHGLPERHIEKSSKHYGSNTCNFGSCCDALTPNNTYCYRAACFETTRQLVKRLNLPEGKYATSFQSRLDDKWLKPYSDKIVIEKAKSGVKRMLVFSPAFVSDCLETIYEIGVEYNHYFKENGGEHIQLVESLNAHPHWVETLKQLILEHN